MTDLLVGQPRLRQDSGLSAPGPTVVLAGGGRLARAVPWGQPWQVGTAAHWLALTRYAVTDGLVATEPHRHRLGATLQEEVAACMLGGFGMPFEIGLAAFHVLRDAGMLRDHRTSAAEFESVLRNPLRVGTSLRRYRFPRQRAHRLAGALEFLRASPPSSDPVRTRDWLTGAPGIGLKTASWIVRNHYDCDDVAVLDVHVIRAGVAAGVFDAQWTPVRDYEVMEQLFLSWARHGPVSAADLDAVIWAEQATVARQTRRTRRP